MNGQITVEVGNELYELNGTKYAILIANKCLHFKINI